MSSIRMWERGFHEFESCAGLNLTDKLCQCAAITRLEGEFLTQLGRCIQIQVGRVSFNQNMEGALQPQFERTPIHHKLGGSAAIVLWE